MLNLKEEELYLSRSIVISFLGFALFNLYEVIQEPFFSNIPLTIIYHKNILSSLLFLSLPFAIYNLINSNSKWKMISVVYISIAFVLMFLLSSKAVYFALFSSLLFYVIFNYGKTNQRRILIKGGVFFISIIFIFNALTFLSGSNDSLNERKILWNKTFQLIKDKPLIGVGSANWQYNYSKFSVKNLDKSSNFNIDFKRPHNDFLSIASETGIIGLIIISMLFMVISRAFLKEYLNKRSRYLLILYSTLVGLLVISFFSFPKERMMHILLIGLLFALIAKHSNLQTVLNFKSKTILFSLLFIGVIFNVSLGFCRLQGEYYTRKILYEQRKGEAKNVIDLGNKALSPFYNTDPTNTPITDYLGWSYNMLYKYDSLLIMNQQSYEISPYNYKVLSNYGYALNQSKKIKSSREILREAHRINPKYEPTKVNLAILEYSIGNYHEAFRWISSIKNYKQKYNIITSEIEKKLHFESLPD